MNPKSTSSPLRLLWLAWLLVPALVIAIFTIGVQISSAQSADTDGDGYADEVEEELGSNFANAESTPEHFSLLWSCTDGNDNDKDGTRDFADQGCRVTGSPAPTPVATATTGPTATPGSGSGSGSGGGSSGSGGSGSGAGNSGSGSGQGSTNGSGTSGTGTGDSDDGGHSSVAGIGAAGSTSGGDGGSTSGGGDDASSADGSSGGGGGGFPWMLALLILAAVLAVASLCYALVARRRAHTRSYRMAKP